MKHRKIILLPVLMALFAVLFSSCVEDDNYGWEEAYIRNAIRVESTSGGLFKGVYDIDLEHDIYNFNDVSIGRYVNDIEYVGGDIIIRSNKSMRELILVVFGRNGESARIDLGPIYDSKDNLFDSESTYLFLRDVTDLLRRYGYVEVEYYGVSDWTGRGFMDIDVYIDIDALVRH